MTVVSIKSKIRKQRSERPLPLAGNNERLTLTQKKKKKYPTADFSTVDGRFARAKIGSKRGMVFREQISERRGGRGHTRTGKMAPAAY